MLQYRQMHSNCLSYRTRKKKKKSSKITVAKSKIDLKQLIEEKIIVMRTKKNVNVEKKSSENII